MINRRAFRLGLGLAALAIPSTTRESVARAVVLADPLFFREAASREVVVAGGLISYGASFSDLFRRAALGLTIPPALLVRADEVIR
jgi:hypothetical protein